MYDISSNTNQELQTNYRGNPMNAVDPNYNDLMSFNTPTHTMYLNKEPYIHGEEWRDIPIAGLEQYQASSLGRVKDKWSNAIKPQLINDRGYLQIAFPNRNCKTHRLICAAFNDWRNITDIDVVTDTGDGIPYHVNHIDGDKLNNKRDNLEWTNPKLNVNHAIDAGLYSTANLVTFEHKPSGEAKTYPSLNAAARAFNIRVDDILMHSGGHKHCSKLDGFRITVTKPAEHQRNTTGSSVSVFDPVTVSTTVCSSVREAAELTAVNRNLIEKRLVEQDTRLTAGYIFSKPGTDISYALSVSPGEAMASRDLYKSRNDLGIKVDTAKSVEVMELPSKIVKKYLSLKYAIDHYGDDESTVRRLINHNDPFILHQGKRVYKWEDDRRPWTMIKHYKPKLAYAVKDYLTGKIHKFATAGLALDLLGIMPADALRNQTLIKGITRPHRQFFVMIDDGRELEFPEFTEEELKKSINLKAAPSFRAKNYITGEECIMKSAKDVMAATGKSPKCCFEYSYHPKFPLRTNSGWMLKKEEDMSEWPDASRVKIS
jgi:hypothetical protein